MWQVAYKNRPLTWESPQTSGHSSSRISNLLLRSLKPPSSHLSKSSFFICPGVSARFLHCFCTVSRDAMGTLTCKIRQRVQKLQSEKSRCFAQKWRKLETFKIRVACPVGSFNQRARDSSSLERTKRTINRWKKRFVVFFVLYGLLGLVPMIFSKNSEVRGTKMKKIQKNYELNAGESFRLDKNGLHGVTAQGRIKMSLLLVLE